MKRFLITAMYDGTIYQTDDKDVAETYAMNDENFVVDLTEGKWIQTDGERVDIANWEDTHKPFNSDESDG